MEDCKNASRWTCWRGGEARQRGRKSVTNGADTEEWTDSEAVQACGQQR